MDEEKNQQDKKEETVADVFNTLTDKQKEAVAIIIDQILKDEKGVKDDESGEKKDVKHSDSLKEELNDTETVEDVYNTLTDKQKRLVNFLVNKAFEDAKSNSKGDNSMKHNVFDGTAEHDNVISHADQMEILNMAKNPTVGTFRNALHAYADDNGMELMHAETAAASGVKPNMVEQLYPDYQDVRPGEPDLVTNDQSWVTAVLNKVEKSPISRVRTKAVDIRELEKTGARGYKKGNKKVVSANSSVLRRTTDPQTVYVKGALNRDDIVDITDFDYVKYMYGVDKLVLNESLATAILIGDGRDDSDEEKIFPSHIRPIWTDEDIYTMHVDLEMDNADKAALQGSGTDTNFGEGFVVSEAMVSTILNASEEYRGTGTPDLFALPSTVNKMLLARDKNGRRIYNSIAELATALGVGHIYKVKQFVGKTRKTSEGKTKKLHAIYGNLGDYTTGATKGGQITSFNQFDIDFNQMKSLIETRTSGAISRVLSFIAIEETVETSSIGG